MRFEASARNDPPWGLVKGQIRAKEAWRRSAADRQKRGGEKGEAKENGEETIIGRWTGGKWTQKRMEWRGGEGKVTQRLGGGRAGRDEHWRCIENEGRREEIMRGTTPRKPETIDIVGTTEAETIDIVGTTELPSKGGVGGGHRKWKGGEYMRYCREIRIDIWEGVWRRAGEEILPRRGMG